MSGPEAFVFAAGMCERQAAAHEQGAALERELGNEERAAAVEYAARLLRAVATRCRVFADCDDATLMAFAERGYPLSEAVRPKRGVYVNPVTGEEIKVP